MLFEVKHSNNNHYATVVIDNILWPDYSTDDIDRAILEYNSRNRRFGGV